MSVPLFLAPASGHFVSPIPLLVSSFPLSYLRCDSLAVGFALALVLSRGMALSSLYGCMSIVVCASVVGTVSLHRSPCRWGWLWPLAIGNCVVCYLFGYGSGSGFRGGVGIPSLFISLSLSLSSMALCLACVSSAVPNYGSPHNCATISGWCILCLIGCCLLHRILHILASSCPAHSVGPLSLSLSHTYTHIVAMVLALVLSFSGSFIRSLVPSLLHSRSCVHLSIDTPARGMRVRP